LYKNRSLTVAAPKTSTAALIADAHGYVQVGGNKQNTLIYKMSTPSNFNIKNQRNGCQSREKTYQSRDCKGAVNGTTKPIPLAYFITFSCYGTHLHGQEATSVDRMHNKYGAPHLHPDEQRRQVSARNMNQDQYILDNARARIVLDAIINTSIHRQWNLMAAHVRSTHVHVIVQALDNPEKIMNALKSYASRALNEAGFENPDQRRWTRHGSTRYVWQAEELANAIQYVLHEQGEPMVVYENKNEDIEAVFKQRAKILSAP
jgi:REP element-mobilizing transposase RayT